MSLSSAEKTASEYATVGFAFGVSRVFAPVATSTMYSSDSFADMPFDTSIFALSAEKSDAPHPPPSTCSAMRAPCGFDGSMTQRSVSLPFRFVDEYANHLPSRENA